MSFINFCLAHYELIISCLLLLLSVLMALFKKKPVSDIQSVIFNLVVDAVKFTESFCESKGQAKLDFCLTYINECLKTRFPDLDISRYKEFIISCIELILSTPQKK